MRLNCFYWQGAWGMDVAFLQDLTTNMKEVKNYFTIFVCKMDNRCYW